MAFPFSIQGALTVALDRIPTQFDIVRRIVDALRSETIETVVQDDDRVSFRCDLSLRKERPAGEHWLFAFSEAGEIRVARRAGDVRIRYELSCRTAFREIAIASLVFGAAFLFVTPMWTAICVAAFLWVFGMSYFEKSMRFRRWLRRVVTSAHLPQPRALKMPDLSA